MKLVRANVTCFGKLKNVAFDFADGVNVMQQANGFGKSTLCAFVRAMLYGLNYGYKTVDGTRTNDVTRYMPWDCTGKFGGSLELSHQGKVYRIERFFGSTAKSESLQIVELSTGRQLTVDCPGEYFLGLAVESYDRCTYLPQEQVDITPNENFDNKLANLVEDSALDYDKLQEKLRAYKKNLKHERGIGGEIPTLEGEIFQLQRQLQNAQSNADERTRKARELAETEAVLKQLAAEETQIRAAVEELQQRLYQAKPSQADVELVKKIDDVESKIATVPQCLNEDFANFNRLLEQKKQQEQRLKPLAYKRKLLGILAAVTIVLSVVLVILKQYLISGVSAVFSIGFAVWQATLKSKGIVQNIAEIQRTLDGIVAKYVNPNGKSFDEACNELWKYHNDYQTNLSIRKALGQRPTVSGDENKIAAELAQTKARLQALTERIQQLTHTQHQLQFALSQPTPSIVDIADELFAKQQLLAQAKRKYQIATKTADILAQAKVSLSSAYVPELCARTEKLLNTVTRGNYNVATDRTFAISLRENGQTKPLSAFSRGIKEITLLCFRIALAELIYGKDIPLLIVDDAFVNFDEQNFARATALLKQLSQNTQVIYFTCHDRMGNL